jgi:hypothetical protein
MLARTMGLHRLTSREQVSLSDEDIQERVQLFRCIYMQDIGFGVARGSTCWLHSLDCVPLCELTQGPKADPRIQLTLIQDAFLQPLYEKNSSKSELQRLVPQSLERLEQWAIDHHIFTTAVLGDSTSLDLRQGFFATRIAVLSHHSSSKYRADAIVDSRVACGMLLLVCTACTPCNAEKLAPTDTYPVVGAGSNDRSATLYSQMGLTNFTDLPFLATQLVEQFPIAAFFLLATGLVNTRALSRDTDLELLHRISILFSDLGARRPANNHIHKLGRVFRLVLDAVRQLCPSDLPSEILFSDSGQNSSSHSSIASTQAPPTPELSAYPWDPSTLYSAPDGILPHHLLVPSHVGANATMDATMTTTTSLSRIPNMRDLQPGGTVPVHDALQQLAWMQVPDALRDSFWRQQSSSNPGNYYHNMHGDLGARVLLPEQVDPVPDMDLDFCLPEIDPYRQPV